jgi:uridylate kinase
MQLVIKIGGSILTDDKGEINLDVIKKYSSILKEIHSNDNSIFIVVGGGKIAREYIEYLRNLGASEFLCDMIGIECSRLNARVLITSLNSESYPKPIEDFNKVIELSNSNKILVMGGTQPGQSTNAVAALLAEIVKADFIINLTNVDGVYTADPKKDSSAKLLNQVTIDELEKILTGQSVKAGSYPLFDPIAIKIVRRSKIPTLIINGKDPNNIKKAIKGEKIGTRIIT